MDVTEMNLRTFEEMKICSNGIYVLDFEAARRNAIFWAKYCTQEANKEGLSDSDVKFWTAKRLGIMEIFELTDEDLEW